MGFPIPYAGVLPRLLFTAAISMSSIRDLFLSLLESVGIISMTPIHNFNDSSSSLDHDSGPSQSYFNPHLQAPADHPLFLRRTAFFDAIQASLPVVLYESLSFDRLAQRQQQCPHADAMLSLQQEPLQAVNLQNQLVLNSLGLGDSVLVDSNSSLSLMSSSSPSSSSSSLCPAASHEAGSPAEFEQNVWASTIPQSDKRIERFMESEASSSHSHVKTPSEVLSTAYDLQIKPQKPVMSTRSSAAYVATAAEPYISQCDQLQEHRPRARTALSLPCSCDATVASSHVDNHLQQRTVARKLQNQAPTARSPISACAQEGAAGSSLYACDYHLQQRAECAVCLCEFEKWEEVRELPLCSHIFHKDCIDGWLLHNHRTCPLCRSSLLTPAIEMQEKMRDQELSDQLTFWFNSLQQEEGAAYQDHYLQHLHHHQDFYYTLQPAGNS